MRERPFRVLPCNISSGVSSPAVQLPAASPADGTSMIRCPRREWLPLSIVRKEAREPRCPKSQAPLISKVGKVDPSAHPSGPGAWFRAQHRVQVSESAHARAAENAEKRQAARGSSSMAEDRSSALFFGRLHRPFDLCDGAWRTLTVSRVPRGLGLSLRGGRRRRHRVSTTVARPRIRPT